MAASLPLGLSFLVGMAAALTFWLATLLEVIGR